MLDRRTSGETGTYFRREARKKRSKQVSMVPLVAVICGAAIAVSAVWLVLGQRNQARETLSENLHDNMMMRLTGGIDHMTIAQNDALRRALDRVHGQGVAVVLENYGLNAQAGWKLYESTVARQLDFDPEVDQVYTSLGIVRPIGGVHLGTPQPKPAAPVPEPIAEVKEESVTPTKKPPVVVAPSQIVEDDRPVAGELKPEKTQVSQPMQMIDPDEDRPQVSERKFGGAL